TGMRAFLIFVIASLQLRAFLPRDNRYAVITLLPKDTRAITDFRELFKGKLIVRTLRLLHTKNVRPDGFKPANDVWQPRDDGIDVPGGDLHKSCVLVNLTFSTETAQALCWDRGRPARPRT